MKLNEVTTQYVEIPTYEYKPDGSTPVKRMKPMHHVEGTVFCSEKDDMYTIYQVVNNTGLYITHCATPVAIGEGNTVEKLIDQYIKKCMNVEPIRMIDILWLNEIGMKKLAELCKESRDIALQSIHFADTVADFQSAFEAEQKAKQDREQARELVQTAIEDIRAGKRVINTHIIVDGTEQTLFRHLLNTYEIKVPTRTAGWIDQKLNHANFEGNLVTVNFKRSKSTDKCSEKVFDLLEELQKKICERERTVCEA